MYGRTINKVSKSALGVSNKTPKIINFGDSVTAKGVPYFIKGLCNQYNINPVFMGTVNDEYGVHCEARGGWLYAQYIGLRTTDSHGTLLTSFPNFLKLATSTDKANHPDWCFRRTGKVVELSYAQDADKTGDFYIFDFANYLSINSYSSPDIITLAMGTNDFWLYDDDTQALNICKLAVQIMTTQILAAAPNCKIGVVPNHTWGTKEISNYATEQVIWNEACQTLVDSLRSSLSTTNINIVGAYMNQGADMSFPYTQGNPVSTGAVSSEFNMTDGVHPTIFGTMEYGRTLGYYIINQL
jgi:lysophospholipase L1-like esterase